MKNIIKTLALLAFATSFASCSSKELEPEDPEAPSNSVEYTSTAYINKVEALGSIKGSDADWATFTGTLQIPDQFLVVEIQGFVPKWTDTDSGRIAVFADFSVKVKNYITNEKGDADVQFTEVVYTNGTNFTIQIIADYNGEPFNIYYTNAIN